LWATGTDELLALVEEIVELPEEVFALVDEVVVLDDGVVVLVDDDRATPEISAPLRSGFEILHFGLSRRDSWPTAIR
jgi:hypothetical protein